MFYILYDRIHSHLRIEFLLRWGNFYSTRKHDLATNKSPTERNFILLNTTFKQFHFHLRIEFSAESYKRIAIPQFAVPLRNLSARFLNDSETRGNQPPAHDRKARKGSKRYSGHKHKLTGERLSLKVCQHQWPRPSIYFSSAPDNGAGVPTVRPLGSS